MSTEVSNNSSTNPPATPPSVPSQQQDDETSQDSVKSASNVVRPAAAPASKEGTPVSVKAKRKTQLRGVSVFLSEMGAGFGDVPPEIIIEYRWPPDSNDKFFLQEQITEYLGIKSFKRKYPDFARRTVDPIERDFLKENGVVTENQVGLGLTALQSTDVWDLMKHDYPMQFAAYQEVCREKNKIELAEKAREMQMIRQDTKKMAELRKKAIKAAAEYNSDIYRDRIRTKGYWDLQTMQIQYPVKKPKLDFSKQASTSAAYPCALIQGQFQEHYKTYTSEELNKLPLGSALKGVTLIPKHRPSSPPRIVVRDFEVQNAQQRRTDTASVSIKTENIAEKNSAASIATDKECAFCRESIMSDDKFVACVECGSHGHPYCMEMTEIMYKTVKSYKWLCMECKPCSVCSKLDEEDKMLFCDLCDRGYHTFCVGLESLPKGGWVCQKYCNSRTIPKQEPMSKPAKVVHTKCRDCGVQLTHNNKVHHRSKYRYAGLCNNCVMNRSR